MNLEKSFLLLLCLFVTEVSSLPQHEDEALDDTLSKSPNLETKKTEDLIDFVLSARHAKRRIDKTKFTIRDVLLKKRMSPRKPEVRKIEEKPHAHAYLKDLTAGSFVVEDLEPMNWSKKQEHDCVDKSYSKKTPWGTWIRVVTCRAHATYACSNNIKYYGTRLCDEVKITLHGIVFNIGCKCFNGNRA